MTVAHFIFKSCTSSIISFHPFHFIVGICEDALPRASLHVCRGLVENYSVYIAKVVAEAEPCVDSFGDSSDEAGALDLHEDSPSIPRQDALLNRFVALATLRPQLQPGYIG